MGAAPTSPSRRHGVRRAAGLAAVAGLCLLAAPAPAPVAAKGASPGLGKALERLTARPDGPPAAIALVQRPGRGIKVFRSGSAELGSGERPRRRSFMRVASVSKAFSGATALALVEDGRLGLDDTIGERLPGLPADWHPVTLSQLLAHTSGLPDFSASQAFRDAFVASLTVPPPPRQLLAYVEGEPLEFPPGTDFRYSNSDNVVVGLMIEAATGEPYAAVLGEEVRAPLGLRQTQLPVGPQLQEPAIHGYDVFSDPPEDETGLAAAGWSWASGGITSTPNNLNRFIRGYLDGSLFGPALQDAQLDLFPGAHSEPPGPGANAAGLGIFRYRTRCGTVYGHTGNIFGYTQFAAANRNGRRSATVSISRQYDERLLGQLRRAESLAVCAAMRR